MPLNIVFLRPQNWLRLKPSQPQSHPCFTLENWTHILFLKLFGHPRGFPGKNSGGGCCKKCWFPWVSKDIPNFLAPTPTHGRPHPTRRHPDLEIWVRIPFSCLNFGREFLGWMSFGEPEALERSWQALSRGPSEDRIATRVLTQQ